MSITIIKSRNDNNLLLCSRHAPPLSQPQCLPSSSGLHSSNMNTPHCPRARALTAWPLSGDSSAFRGTDTLSLRVAKIRYGWSGVEPESHREPHIHSQPHLILYYCLSSSIVFIKKTFLLLKIYTYVYIFRIDKGISREPRWGEAVPPPLVIIWLQIGTEWSIS